MSEAIIAMGFLLMAVVLALTGIASAVQRIAVALEDHERTMRHSISMELGRIRMGELSQIAKAIELQNELFQAMPNEQKGGNE